MVEQSIGWRFLPNPADEDEGLAHAGIEFFRDAPYSGVARECGQNSLDAAIPGDTRVTLRFTRIAVANTDFPDLSSLTRTFDACLARGKARKSEKEVDFFARASGILRAEKIPILLISDEGTVGLSGPCEQGTPYHALVKASGVSEKFDKSSGGSFGIGKNAAYAVSALRTVFYSTRYREAGKEIDLAQGKAILVSHDTQHGKFKSVGYWGTGNFQPIETIVQAPAWMKRSLLGTTVAVAGFMGENKWEYEVVESLIRNFFVAIERSNIEFEVNDDIDVGKATLAGLFKDPEVLAAAERHGFEEDLEFSEQLHRCFVSAETHRQTTKIPGLGEVRLHILVAEGLQKRVALIRNGMYITSSLQHFGDKLARFALQKEFVAIIEPVDKETGEIIRSLENPKHDELSPERVEDRQRQRTIKSAFKFLIAWLRKSIKERTTIPPESETLLDEMNEFFSTPANNSRPPEPGAEENPERLKVLKSTVRPRSAGRGGVGTEGGSGGKKPSRRKGGLTSGPGTGSGRGGKGEVGSAIRISALRSHIPFQGSPSSRVIHFTPEFTGAARLRVFALGVADPQPLPILTLDGIGAIGGAAAIDVVSNSRSTHEAKFDVDYSGPIEIELVVTSEGFVDEAH